MNSKTATLSELLREIESDLGTRDMSILVFRAFSDALTAFKPADVNDFCDQLEKLVEVLSNTEPKFGILDYTFKSLLRDFKSGLLERKVSNGKCKKLLVRKIENIVANGKEEKLRLLKYSETLKIDGKTILIHDHSHTVHDILSNFKAAGKEFKVVIAEQDFEKTHSNIERIHKLGVPFQVVPAYMLSHVHGEIDMAFFGALTLKDTMHFVMDPGTYGVISELHLDNIPIYMFIESKKFSLWKSKERGEIFMHKHKRKHHKKSIRYERIKYSHDRVPADLFYRTVTNEGIFDFEQLKENFSMKMAQISD